MNEYQIFDNTVRIHLMALQMLAERNLLRYEKLDLGKRTYGPSLKPERGTQFITYFQSDTDLLIVGMVSPQVRDSDITINHLGPMRNLATEVPVHTIASKTFDRFDQQGEPYFYQPLAWYVRRFDRLEFKLNWNGFEHPGELVLALIYLDEQKYIV